MLVLEEFPDPEDMLFDYLTERLPLLGYTVSIGTGYPEKRQGDKTDTPFVRLALLGGSEISMLSEEVIFDIEAWHSTPREARNLLQAVRSLLRQLPDEIQQVSYIAETARPYRLADPISNQPRYVMQIRYGVALTLRTIDNG